jgi:NAD(P)H dehydrogenase (quinone)
VLRMPWYSENYTMALGPAIERGAIYGATGEGKLATASRGDLAAAAVGALLRSPGGKTYELAGNHPWTMPEFAAEVSRQAGKPVEYVNQSESDYARTLEGAGLPPPVATLLASTSYLAGEGELYSESKDLSELAGRPSTPISETIAAALKG